MLLIWFHVGIVLDKIKAITLLGKVIAFDV